LLLDIHPTANRNDLVGANSHRFRVGVLGLSRKDSGVVDDALDCIVGYHACGKQRPGNREDQQRKICAKSHPATSLLRLVPWSLLKNREDW
jgi:hypothetical protein